MENLIFFGDYTTWTLIVLSVLSLTAGFIDAVVGGGGLVQIPALLINLPNHSLPTLFGTNKIAALPGTAVAAHQYSKRIKFDFMLLAVISMVSFFAAYLGAKAVVFIQADTLKPVVLIILILIAIYTFIKKDLGSVEVNQLTLKEQFIFGSLVGIIVGFYDGFFGPGTGSFFVLGFVVILGFDFLKASAYAKVVNCLTNISALIVFTARGNYLLEIAILMSVFNIVGSVVGSRIAIKKGNGFVRILFLAIVSIMILRYGYDVFLDNRG